MTIPTRDQLLALDYGLDGAPFVQVTAKSTLTTLGLDYGLDGAPFVASEDAALPPDPAGPTFYVLIMAG